MFAFADFDDVMRHSSITTVPYPVNCDRRHDNHLFKPPADDVCHKTSKVVVCVSRSVFCDLKQFCNAPPTHRGTTGGRRKCRWPETMQSTSMNTTVSSLNDNNDTSTQQKIPKKGSLVSKILSMNCNSIKGSTKNCSFRALLQQHDPHVILGCESKIDCTFPTYSLFPSHYTEVHRKDRTKHGGRVFCAIRGDVLATEQNDVSKDNECVWCSIQLP